MRSRSSSFAFAFALPLLLLLLAAGACVPADQALPLGSAQFTITARGSARVLGTDVVVDGWSIHVDRYLVSFRTMTIVNLTDTSQCAYRGRGAETNVVFDGTEGSVVQAFNGIMPGDCTDVGMRLGSPDDVTTVGEGATPADLVTLATGKPAHALFEATATHTPVIGNPLPHEVIKVSLRFDTERTSSAFGGCRDAIRGVKILPEARYAVFVSLAAEAFFRDAVAPAAQLRFEPFLDADLQGDNNGTVTMDELDQVPLVSVPGQFYELPTGGRNGTFGDYVRAQFMFSLHYGNGGGCDGIVAGTPLDQ
jgi:hypothetical protein